jgi:small-conductance mechanosensitive channel
VRRRVGVGVAYGSDVAKVLKVLQEVVRAHPHVAKEPPPRIWFEEFGASSLDFGVWFFTRIDRGLEAMSGIRQEIARRFQEEGLEIPFPQQDLHLRSVDDPRLAAFLLEGRPPRRE